MAAKKNVVQQIRRATRRTFGAEEKIRIRTLRSIPLRASRRRWFWSCHAVQFPPRNPRAGVTARTVLEKGK